MHKSLSRDFRSKTPVRIAYALIIMMLMMGASGSYSPSSKANNSPADTAIVTDTWAVQVLPGTSGCSRPQPWRKEPWTNWVINRLLSVSTSGQRHKHQLRHEQFVCPRTGHMV